MVRDLGKELANIAVKSSEAGYSPVLLQERWKAVKESKAMLFGMFTSILGKSEDGAVLQNVYDENVTRRFEDTQQMVISCLEKAGYFECNEKDSTPCEKEPSNSNSTLRMQKIEFEQFKGDRRSYPS